MDPQEIREESPQPFMLRFLERVDAHPSGEFSDDPTYAGSTGLNQPDYDSD